MLFRSGSLYLSLAGLVLFGSGLAYKIVFKKLTRRIIGFKDFFVTASYLALLVLYVRYINHPFNLAVFFALTIVFCRRFLSEVFCDLKDIDDDRAGGIRTLAVVWPRRRLVVFLAAANVLSVVPIILGVLLDYFPLAALGLVAVAICFLAYIRRLPDLNNSQLTFYSHVFADGEYLLWPVLLFAARMLG